MKGHEVTVVSRGKMMRKTIAVDAKRLLSERDPANVKAKYGVVRFLWVEKNQ